jgi:hypothetical protein
MLCAVVLRECFAAHTRSGRSLLVASSEVAKSAIFSESTLHHQDGEWQERTAGDTGATFFYNTQSALMVWEVPPAYKVQARDTFPVECAH